MATALRWSSFFDFLCPISFLLSEAVAEVHSEAAADPQPWSPSLSEGAKSASLEEKWQLEQEQTKAGECQCTTWTTCWWTAFLILETEEILSCHLSLGMLFGTAKCKKTACAVLFEQFSHPSRGITYRWQRSPRPHGETAALQMCSCTQTCSPLKRNEKMKMCSPLPWCQPIVTALWQQQRQEGHSWIVSCWCMTTLYGISFVAHAVFQCHISLFKCFYDSPLPFSFCFGYFPLGFWDFISPPLLLKKRRKWRKNPNPSKWQTPSVKFHYPGSEAELFVLLISMLISHMYCPEFWFPSHKPTGTKKEAVQCIVF